MNYSHKLILYSMVYIFLMRLMTHGQVDYQEILGSTPRGVGVRPLGPMVRRLTTDVVFVRFRIESCKKILHVPADIIFVRLRLVLIWKSYESYVHVLGVGCSTKFFIKLILPLPNLVCTLQLLPNRIHESLKKKNGWVALMRSQLIERWRMTMDVRVLCSAY